MRFDLVSNKYLLIIFFLLPFLLLSLPLPHLLALGQHLHRRPLLLLHLLLSPYLFLLDCSAVVLMHLPLLFHISSLFVFPFSPSLLAQLQILIPKILLKIILIAALLIDFSLQKVLSPNNFLELSTLGVKHLLPDLKFMQ